MTLTYETHNQAQYTHGRATARPYARRYNFH